MLLNFRYARGMYDCATDLVRHMEPLVCSTDKGEFAYRMQVAALQDGVVYPPMCGSFPGSKACLTALQATRFLYEMGTEHVYSSARDVRMRSIVAMARERGLDVELIVGRWHVRDLAHFVGNYAPTEDQQAAALAAVMMDAFDVARSILRKETR